MFKKIKSYANIFWQMFKMDLVIFKKDAVGGIIDSMIWVGIILAVVSYIYPLLGMTQSFGAMWLVGAIVSCCVFEIWGYVASFIADKEGSRTIDYLLTLPIPSWLVFIKFVATAAFKTSVYSLIIIPLGKLILLNRMSLDNFSAPKFILMFFVINIFFAFFSLIMSTIPDSIPTIRKVWVRIIFPLWFLGGVEYPWQIVYKFSPKVAYALLLNPFIYAMEGIRATVLGQSNYINVWLCLIVLITLTIILGFWGIFRLKKQLDFV